MQERETSYSSLEPVANQLWHESTEELEETFPGIRCQSSCGQAGAGLCLVLFSCLDTNQPGLVVTDQRQICLSCAAVRNILMPPKILHDLSILACHNFPGGADVYAGCFLPSVVCHTLSGRCQGRWQDSSRPLSLLYLAQTQGGFPKLGVPVWGSTE